ncbi:hypothetical protein Tco_1246291 [Tanacetum coccineum]
MQSSRQYKSRNNILANRNNAGREFECVSNAQEIHHDSTKVQSPVVVADGSETMSSSSLRLLQRLLHDSSPYIGLSVHGAPFQFYGLKLLICSPP